MSSRRSRSAAASHAPDAAAAPHAAAASTAASAAASADASPSSTPLSPASAARRARSPGHQRKWTHTFSDDVNHKEARLHRREPTGEDEELPASVIQESLAAFAAEMKAINEAVEEGNEEEAAQAEDAADRDDDGGAAPMESDHIDPAEAEADEAKEQSAEEEDEESEQEEKVAPPPPAARSRKSKSAAAAATPASTGRSRASAHVPPPAPVAAPAPVVLSSFDAIDQVESNMSALLASPALFFAPDAEHARKCLQSTKLLYDLGKNTAPVFLSVANSVPSLLTHTAPMQFKGKAAPIPFSSDQIYAQLSMHSTPLLQRMTQQIRALQRHVDVERAALAAKSAAGDDADDDAHDEEAQMRMDEEDNEDEEDGGEDGAEEDGDEQMNNAEEDGEDGEDDGEDEEGEDADGVDPSAAVGAYKGRGGVTEDAFFSLDDMERFADMYEGQEDEGAIEPEDDEGMGEGEEGEDDGSEDEAMDVEALRRRALRQAHDKSLKPLPRLGDEEVDLDEDVGEVPLGGGERYEDFFDAPPPGLVGSGKGSRGKGKGKGKSMEEHYAAEDAEEYVDDDAGDEFGGAFAKLSTSAREGSLGQATLEGKKVVKERNGAAAASAAASAPVNEKELSSYEKSNRRLAEQISQLEKKIVAPREWAQLGEVTGKARPMDSLLDTNLEFEHAGRVAPVITQEYTEELEAMIRRRVLKDEFNDVVRKLDPELSKKKKKPTGEELNDQKSAIGLAEVYEQEYVAEKNAAEGRPTASEEKKSAAHEEIAGLVGALFHKLDSLCNFHFTPRSVHADDLEVRAKPNVSAISMEEQLPTHMSSAAATAPQDLYDISEKTMIGSTERSSDEKKNQHRRTKAMRKKAHDAGLVKEKERMKAMGTMATQGNAAQGILRTAISSKEMKAATSARNVIQAGGKGAAQKSPSASAKKGPAIAHGQNTKFSNSSAFFGKMQKNADGPREKKQKR